MKQKEKLRIAAKIKT